jgi:hypothetical protein
MPQIKTRDLHEARSRLKGPASGPDARAPYREAIANLVASRMLELEPDADESMRSLKLSVTRVAKEVNRTVRYGESDSGTLLVWLESGTQRRSARRRRPSGTDRE